MLTSYLQVKLDFPPCPWLVDVALWQLVPLEGNLHGSHEHQNLELIRPYHDDEEPPEESDKKCKAGKKNTTNGFVLAARRLQPDDDDDDNDGTPQKTQRKRVPANSPAAYLLS